MTSGLVLSFLRRASDTNDWTQQELAEFYRVESALVQVGLSVTIDRGISDEGDPWFVFCRADNEEVIAHFARVDREYVIVSSVHSGIARGRDFRLLVRQTIESHLLMLPIRRSRDQKIFLHPAALLTAMLAAAYFLTTEKETVGSNSSSDNAKNTSIISLLTQKFGVLMAAGLAAIWLEHQAASVFKFPENIFHGSVSHDDKGGAHVAELAHDGAIALDPAIMQSIRDGELGAHRIDLSNPNLPAPQNGNENNVVSKPIMQASSQFVNGPDDSNANPANIPNLSANNDHVLPVHLDVTQNDIDNTIFLNNVQPVMPVTPVMPVKDGATALVAANQLNVSSSQTSSSSSIVATSEAVVQLAVSDASSASIQPVVLSNGTVTLNVALQQVFAQVGFGTDLLHNESTTNASGTSSSTVASSRSSPDPSPSQAQILHTIEQFLQNTPSFEVAVSGHNIVIVDTKVADAHSPNFGLLTWDMSNGSTLSIVGIVPHHHHAS
jgi:hypothetical protein